jgi:hypothetical protein
VFVLTHHPEDATPAAGVTFLNCAPAEAVRAPCAPDSLDSDSSGPDGMLAYMKRTTVKIPEALDARLRHEAERRGVTISDVSREALEAYLVGPPGRRRLGAAKAGHSGHTDISERIEEILAAEVQR